MTRHPPPWWSRIGVRYRLVAAHATPLYYELPAGKPVQVTYEELTKHIGGRELAAVSCLTRTFSSVLLGGAQMPDMHRIYTGAPRLLGLWPGDSMTFTAVKDGRAELTAMRPVYVSW